MRSFKLIDEYVSSYPSVITYLPLEKNVGLGNALRYGLEHCENEFVARMDADDISLSDRIERQLEFFENNPDVDIVGGNISELADSSENIVDYRIVPQTHDEICTYLKSRSLFNHVTVMLKKERGGKSKFLRELLSF